ncbi:MAG TPA: YbhB/YbcL family Raf kinase inhibitor-like protein [Candidatus Binataceae bacterium]|nr:YbhB/YbcL family Raf kinase inhibitor-like protein [Candidatus Binataceae bacterium]
MTAHVKSVPVLVILVSLALALPSVAQNTPKLSVTSSAFAAGATIPIGYSCKSPNVESPPLRWNGVPNDAKTLVLILKDPDAPNGTFIHWVVYNLPASLSGLDANAPPTDKLANGAIQGANSVGQIGYMGPCPPPGSVPHHYHFELSALDIALSLKPGATATQVEDAAQGHVKATGDLVGTFAR